MLQPDAPTNLDEETRLEWTKWVGRSVVIRPGLAGKVVGVQRRSFHNEATIYGEAQTRTIRIRAEMEGNLWWALRRWTTPDDGQVHSDMVSLNGLTPIFADQRTRLLG